MALIAVHSVLVVHSALVHSPTENEAAHLVAGLHHWDTGSFSLYRVNPPFVKSMASIPVIIAGYHADWSGYYEHVGARPVFDMGEDFVRANGRRSATLMAIARLACLPFSILGAAICFIWARDLFGYSSGCFACCLWCFSPMVLGNVPLITADAHATALGLAACYTFWRWLKHPTWMQAVITGGILGLAELSKTTMVLFYPVWPLIWVIYRWQDRHSMSRRIWVREAGMLALRMAIGIYVLNLGYLGEGSFTSLKDFTFVSTTFSGEESGTGNRFRDTWLGEVPVPFPANYVAGIDIQQNDFESFSRPSYLRGQYREKGWWYYYGYAILVKAPLGTLGLIALTLLVQLSRFRRANSFRDMLVLLLPAVVIFTVVSMKSGFSHHSRYVLPCVPFVFIWISQLAPLIATAWTSLRARISAFRPAADSSKSHSADTAQPFLTSVVPGAFTAALLTWSVASSLAIHPHSLSYFNAVAGGPTKGPVHLINSNVDWGQDLLLLEDWMLSQKTPVFAAFYNFYNPFDLGIDGLNPWPFRAGESPEAADIADGYYAISINLLYEYPWDVRDADGERYRIDRRPLGFLRQTEPIARAGYSICIYSATQLRTAYSKPASYLLPET